MLFLALGFLAAHAQTLTITGQVVEDGSNDPLPGVSIMVTKTKQGVITDANGRFSITVNGRTSVDLLFSFIGYSTQTITANGSKPLRVQLRKEQALLRQRIQVRRYILVTAKSPHEIRAQAFHADQHYIQLPFRFRIGNVPFNAIGIVTYKMAVRYLQLLP